MIITRSWIKEIIDIKNDSDKKIEDILNAIGHEVASVKKITIPDGVVVGKVISCEKHPEADKLSVCKVDIGKEIVQIVCGARNVRADIFVAVAALGAKLPDGLEIKPVVLRGVDSHGMICSSTEIGLPKMNDGIMILDESIGKLKAGKALNSYESLNDTVIEVELTANRGDCLSINGICRELSAANGYQKNTISCDIDDDNAKGIGRVLQIQCDSDVNASLMYKVIESKGIKSNLLTDTRMALAGNYKESESQRVLAYATYMTGVMLHAYDFDFFYNKDIDKSQIKVINENGLDKIIANDKKVASIVGIRHESEAFIKPESKMIIIEASYVSPQKISKIVHEEKIQTDEQFYNSSRGSEPDLEMGICCLCNTISASGKVIFYSEKLQHKHNYPQISINCKVDEINSVIGRKFEKIELNNILKRLYMDVKITPEQDTIMIGVPAFRHDIFNMFDIAEEVVRIVGIDNIPSLPLNFVEMDTYNADYENYKLEYAFIQKSVSQGFFQALHFVFDDKKNNKKYALSEIDSSLELLNPITAELDTLRASLLPALLESTRKNVYKSRKRVALFEIGFVFDKDRNESKKAAFVWCGNKEPEDILNHGKPENIDFKTFIQKIKAVLPTVEFTTLSKANEIIHPFASADVVFDGKVIGFVGKLHPKIIKETDIPATFVAEIDMSFIKATVKMATKTSKYQKSQRDLSVIISKSIPFGAIKKAINSLEIKELKDIYPADFYSDSSLKDNFSLTIRYLLQSSDDSLSEERIGAITEEVLAVLKKDFKAELR